MAFAMYALLGERAPTVTHKWLEVALRELFGSDDGFALGTERLPFTNAESFVLRWPRWNARVTYEEGSRVSADSAEICHQLGAAAPLGLGAIDKRIRVVFGDDDSREYTNEMVELIQFLREIPGVFVFDPQQGDIMK